MLITRTFWALGIIIIILTNKNQRRQLRMAGKQGGRIVFRVFARLKEKSAQKMLQIRTLDVDRLSRIIKEDMEFVYKKKLKLKKLA